MAKKKPRKTTTKRAAPEARPDFPHVTKALEYARAVASGAVYVCKWVRLACERQLRDLERPHDASWPYVFRPELAERACAFLEQLPHMETILGIRGMSIRAIAGKRGIVGPRGDGGRARGMKIAMSDGRSSAYAAAALNADDAVMVGTWPVFGAAVA